MTFFMADVETDGPIPGDYSMTEVGVVIVEPGLQRTFYGRLSPISENYLPEALEICRRTRDETLTFEDPKIVMERLYAWARENTTGPAIFISDNNGFDWSFINWYFCHFLSDKPVMERNPFGHSSRNLNDLYKGMKRDMRVNPKHLKKTKLTHHPVDDAMGNAEALLAMRDMGLKIDL